jgi:hypothetical protein
VSSGRLVLGSGSGWQHCAQAWYQVLADQGAAGWLAAKVARGIVAEAAMEDAMASMHSADGHWWRGSERCSTHQHVPMWVPAAAHHVVRVPSERAQALPRFYIPHPKRPIIGCRADIATIRAPAHIRDTLRMTQQCLRAAAV